MDIYQISTYSTATESSGEPFFDLSISSQHDVISATDLQHNTNESILESLKLSDFTCLEYHEEGVNALVFKAKRDSENLIVKILKQKILSKNSSMEQQMKTEIYILRHASHPNIVKYYGSGNNPRQFVAMEYLKSGTLAGSVNIMGKLRPICLKQIYCQARELANALNYLHMHCISDMTIIHRDLKPDNIGIGNDGELKLFDFGLSVITRRNINTNETELVFGYAGSLRYMAPEIAQGLCYNEKIDVYSYGIVLWQLATQLLPFPSFSREQFLKYVIHENQRPPLDMSWPILFRKLLEGCWAVDPQDRPSFHEILSQLALLE